MGVRFELPVRLTTFAVFKTAALNRSAIPPHNVHCTSVPLPRSVSEHNGRMAEEERRDRFTGRPILPKDRLVHGRYYRGRCRNATVARWNERENCFFHWREKFGHIYVETICYPGDDEPPFDVFHAVEELPNPRFEIPFNVDATFAGNTDDLKEHDAEMWGKVERQRSPQRT